MRWKYLVFGMLIIGWGALLSVLVSPEPPRKNETVQGERSGPILFFGDSLVEGVGAEAERDLASQLALLLGEPVLNYGVAGETTAMALLRIDEALQENPRLAIILLGGNDFLRRISREETARNLEQIIGRFQAQGSQVLLLGVRSGIVAGGSNDLYENVAKKTGAAYEEDVLRGVFGNASLMSDAVHPNSAGYAKMIERIFPVVEELLGR